MTVTVSEPLETTLVSTVQGDGATSPLVGQEVQVAMSYTTNVVLVPGVFQRDWTFNPSTSTRILTGTRIP